MSMQEQPSNPTVHGVPDPENPRGYSLTLRRKNKMYASTKWEVLANGEAVGLIPNGGQLTIKGVVGDNLEVSFGEGLRHGRKTKFNTFEMIIRRPGNLNVTLKQTGDVTVYVGVVICALSVLATEVGFVLGVIPLFLGIVAACVTCYKYGKAEWRQISACHTGNADLHNGAIEHVTTRGRFG